VKNLDDMQDGSAQIVALVVRVSSDAQDTQRQITNVREIHAQHYADLPTEEFFRPEGDSATKRTVFEREPELCEAIEQDRVAVIVTDEQSRLVRGTTSAEWAAFYDLCMTHGVTIHTTLEGVIRDDEASELLSTIRAWDSRREVKKLRHRTRSGKLERAMKGQWPHGAVPTGFARDPETGGLVQTEAAPHVVRAFRDIADGLAKSKARERFEKATRRTISRHGFDKLLRKRAYLGIVPFGEQDFQGLHDPLIDKHTFEAVQRRLACLSAERHREPQRWPYAGVARCGACGGSLRLQEVSSNDNLYTYVRCDNEGCRSPRIPAAHFEGNFVIKLVAFGQALTNVLASDLDFGTPTNDGPTLEEAEDALDMARSHLRKLGQLVADDALDRDAPNYKAAKEAKDAAERMLARVKGQAISYREELAEVASTIKALAILAPDPEANRRDDPYTEACLNMADGWLAADFETRRNVITRTLHRLELHDNAFTLVFRPRLGDAAKAQPFLFPAPPGGRGKPRHAQTVHFERSGFGRYGNRLLADTEPGDSPVADPLTQRGELASTTRRGGRAPGRSPAPRPRPRATLPRAPRAPRNTARRESPRGRA
jgi:DNA invertase Pin-like site-specific DNA recombinase